MTAAVSGNILVIDDDQTCLEIVKTHLMRHGFNVTVTTDPFVFLKEPFTELQDFDAILTDLSMPSLDGRALLQFLKEKSLHIPTIVVTADDSVQSAVELVKAGAFDYLTKPIDFDKLFVTTTRAVRFVRVDRENRNLKDALGDASQDGELCPSASMKRIRELVRRLANSRANVLITGESGVGKEVIANRIHQSGNRPDAPFVAINCSSIPESLLESELFGHAKGAFTGAIGKRVGLFEEANGGTLFLDEIGDLSFPLQAKLLRVLQDRKIKRVGENQYHEIDVALIAATHRDLETEVRNGSFREDLYYRLNVIPIHIPPLRDRREDILPLATYFLNKFCRRHNKGTLTLSRAAKEQLLSLPWYGNIRELENAIERAVVLVETNVIEASDLPCEPSNTRSDKPILQASQDVINLPSVQSLASKSTDRFESVEEWPSLNEHSLQYIEAVLAHCQGVKEKAANVLEIDRKTLYRKLEEIHARGKKMMTDTEVLRVM